MGKQHVLKTADLNSSFNEFVLNFKKNNWLVADIPQGNVFLKDTKRESTAIHGQFLNEKLAKDDDALAAQQLLAFLREQGFEEQEINSIIKFYGQTLLATPYNLLAAAISNEHHVFKKPEHYQGNLAKKDGKIYFICETSQFLSNDYITVEMAGQKIQDVAEKPTKIPGKITVKFVLTDQGFKVEEIDAGNFLLKELLFCKMSPLPSKEKIQLAQEIENLRDIIQDEKYSAELRKRGSVILAIVEKQIDKKLDDLGILQKAVTCTAKTITHPNDENNLTEFKAVLKEVSHSSWGKILAGAMLLFLSAAIIAASTMAACATFGVATPLSALGINIGLSAAASGLSIATTAVGAGIGVGAGIMEYKGLQKHDLAGRMATLSGAATARNRLFAKTQPVTPADAEESTPTVSPTFGSGG